MFYGSFAVFIPLVIYILGIVICSKGLNSDSIFKYGLWFFSLKSATAILSGLHSYVFIPLVVKNNFGSSKLRWVFSLSNIPIMLLNLAASTILVVGLYKSYVNRVTDYRNDV